MIKYLIKTYRLKSFMTDESKKQQGVRSSKYTHTSLFQNNIPNRKS